MFKIEKFFFVILSIAFICGFIAGCSGGPGEEELKQLKDLKAEVEKLQGDVNKLDSEKADLQNQIAKQDEAIKNYQKMTEAIKNCK